MTTKRGGSIIGLFIIALVVSLPIYSANVLAVSVQITKNQGQAAIPKFIDAQGDVWTVEATITGAPQAVTPSDVKIKIGSNEALFQSCSPTALGTACEYISPLTDGVMEGEYAFQAIYTFLNALGLPESVSNSDVIKADGSGPTIEFPTLQQNAQGQVEIGFSVKDKKTGAPAVGIKTIEILDADSGNVLQAITVPAPGTEQYNYDPDAGTNGILPATLSGEGLKRIKLRAEDWLGHPSSQNPVKDFQSDFVVPVIKDNLNFTKIGKFIGNSNVITGMIVDIVETNLKEVKASSSEAGLDNTPANDCLEDAQQEHLWHCIWGEVEVQPTESIAVSILATDHFGNSASKALQPYTLTKDSSAPQIDFFGTERQFEDKSFVKNGKQRIILRVKEQGAGITEEGIRANLLELGKGTAETPTSCEQTETSFNCFWETSASGLNGVARIGLSKFEDRVGNQGQTPEIELVADNAGPHVEKVEVFGVSDVGEKNYFQSNDALKVKLEVVETHGLVILLNLDDVVMDAETQFPETETGPTAGLGAGWAAFLEEDVCTREEGNWKCELETPAIKSGPDSAVNLQIRVQDTAGNDAASWPDTARNAKSFKGKNKGEADYTLDLLGLSLEEKPDFWEVDKSAVRPLLDFVDLDTTPLAFTRFPVQVALKSSLSDVQTVNIKVQSCTVEQQGDGAAPQQPPAATGLAAEQSPTPEASLVLPEISRALIFGGVSSEGDSSPKPKLLIEFSPFDGRESFKAVLEQRENQGTVDIPVQCTLQIFSKVGKVAVDRPEVQEVKFKVPFGFSALGARDENLQGKIDSIRDDWKFEILDKLKYVNEAVKWAQWAQSIIQTINSVMIIYGVFKSSLSPLQASVIASPIAVGACKGVSISEHTLLSGVEWLQLPVAILSCNPNGMSPKVRGSGVLDAYASYQETVLRVYNFWSGRQLIGLPAKSLYENIWTSMIGACAPGIVYNLEKYRQVLCREMICYQRDIPAGIATPESCAQLGEYLSCRFFKGSALATAIPLTGAWDAVIEFLKGWLSSPLGLIRAALQVPCFFVCAYSTAGSSYCSFAAVIIKFGDFIDGVAGLYYSRPTLTQDPYCGQLEAMEEGQKAAESGGSSGGEGGGT